MALTVLLLSACSNTAVNPAASSPPSGPTLGTPVFAEFVIYTAAFDGQEVDIRETLGDVETAPTESGTMMVSVEHPGSAVVFGCDEEVVLVATYGNSTTTTRFAEIVDQEAATRGCTPVAVNPTKCLGLPGDPSNCDRHDKPVRT
jgi:hypothetical protein